MGGFVSNVYPSHNPINVVSMEVGGSHHTSADIAIDSIYDDMTRRGIGITSKADKDAYSAFIRSQVEDIRSKVAALQDSGISGEALNTQVKSIGESLSVSANSYLAKCQSYESMKDVVEIDLQNMSKKIEDTDFNFSSFAIPALGSSVGAGTGALVRHKILEKMAKNAAEKNAKIINDAVEKRAKAVAKHANLFEKQLRAQEKVISLQGQAIKSVAQDKIVDLNKVRAAIEPAKINAEWAVARTVEANEAKKVAEKTTTQVLRNAAKNGAKSAAKKGAHIFAATAVGTAAAGIVGGAVTLGLELLFMDEAN